MFIYSFIILSTLTYFITNVFALPPLPYQTSTKIMNNNNKVNGRKLPPVTMTMSIPLAGSLQHIHGTVAGLDNPTDYRVSNYLLLD